MKPLGHIDFEQNVDFHERPIPPNSHRLIIESRLRTRCEKAGGGIVGNVRVTILGY